MTLNDYQNEAGKSATYPKEIGIVYNALGLAGEAGEVANKVKKVIRDNDGVFTDEIKAKIKGEVGDVMWYLARISHELGYTLEEVAQENVDKLHGRMQRGTIQGSGDNR